MSRYQLSRAFARFRRPSQKVRSIRLSSAAWSKPLIFSMLKSSRINYVTCPEHGKKLSFLNIAKVSPKRALCSDCQLTGELLKLSKLESMIQEALKKQDQKSAQLMQQFTTLKQQQMLAIEKLSSHFQALVQETQPMIIQKFLDHSLETNQFQVLGDYISQNIQLVESQYQINFVTKQREGEINECLQSMEQLLTSIQELSASYYTPPKAAEHQYQCIHNLKGHTKDISAVKFNTAKSQLFSAQLGGDILVWDCPKYTRFQTIEGHTAAVRDIQFTKNDKMCLTASEDHSIRVWLLDERWYQFQKLDGHLLEVISLQLSTSENQVLSCGNDKTIRIWSRSVDGKSWEPKQILNENNGPVRTVCFNSNSSQFASGGADKIVKIWSLKSGVWAVKQPLLGHTDCIHSASFCRVSNLLATGGQDNTIIIWELGRDGQYKSLRILLGHQQRIFTLQFSGDGRYLLSGSADKTIRLWNRNKEWDCTQTLQESGRVYSVSLSDDHLAVGNCTKELPIYGAQTIA